MGMSGSLENELKVGKWNKPLSGHLDRLVEFIFLGRGNGVRNNLACLLTHFSVSFANVSREPATTKTTRYGGVAKFDNNKFPERAQYPQ